jgi:hypothetical protein
MLDMPKDVSNPCVFYGSTTLQRLVALDGTYSPGVWGENDQFNYELHIEKYGTAMLNHDAQVCEFQHLPVFEGYKFIRPVHDGKAFNGQLVFNDDLQEWKDKVQNAHIQMFAETLTMYSDPKDIDVEYRFFVVDKNVVTGSQYKKFGTLTSREVTPEFGAGMRAWEYAQSQVDIWQPATGFVMDICEFGGTHHIIEINSLNCSGFYDCDKGLLIDAIQKLG